MCGVSGGRDNMVLMMMPSGTSVATTATATTTMKPLPLSSSSPSLSKPSLPKPPPPQSQPQHQPSSSSSSCRRRKRSLTGLEMYHEWSDCYISGWHHRLMQLEKLGDVAAITSNLSSSAAEMPGFVEFAAFHNSQLMQPMPCVEHALRVIDGGY